MHGSNPRLSGEGNEMKKYLVIPGDVFSKNDGDRHYVNANDLVRLYRVNPQECVIYRPGPGVRESDYDGLIRLEPRYHGDYDAYLAKAKQ